jgi:O-antigen/teichoic acid export membrane protein
VSLSPRQISFGVGGLTAATAIAGAIGFAQGIYVLRVLGAERYGVAAVVVAIGAVAANLVDFRIGDFVSREFYAWGDGEPAQRTGRAQALRFGLFVSILTGLAIGAATLAIGAVWYAAAGADRAGSSLLLAAAGSQWVAYVGAYLLFVLRLTAPWPVLAQSQIVASAVNAAVIPAAVTWNPTPGGYVIAVLFAAVANAAFALAFAVRSWRDASLPVLARPAGLPFRSDFWSVALAGGVMGFSKLLHRAGDTLLVAWFCAERETGLYRFARSCTDALYMVFDAANKIVQPHLLELLSAGRADRVRRLIANVAAGAAAFGAVTLGAEVLLLPALIAFVGPSYAGAEWLIVVLTVPMLLVLGVQMWLWPILLHHGMAPRFAGASLAGVVLIQYIAPATLGTHAFAQAAMPFALGYALSYALTLSIPLLLGWAQLRRYLGADAADPPLVVECTSSR